MCLHWELCILCKVVGSSARRQPTVAEMSKLETEINFLKRSLDVGKSNFFYILLSDTIFDHWQFNHNSTMCTAKCESVNILQ